MVRRPELDGIRGLAAALVLLGHVADGMEPFGRRGLPESVELFHNGGLVGVQMFFALSGFLITTILLQRVRDGRNLEVVSFWGRRWRRMFPPLAVLCGAYVLLMVLYPPSRGAGTSGWGDVVMALTFSRDEVRWIVPESGWLTHTWSLGIEMQFYLAWPLIVALAVRWHRTRFLPHLVVATLAASVLGRILLHLDPGSGQRDALLLGALVGLLGWEAPRWAAVLGIGSLVVIGTVNALDGPYLYPVTELAAAVAVAGASHLGIFRTPVLRHLGYISLSLYLWHGLLLRTPMHPAVSVVLSFVVAELSYQFVERRFMAHPTPSLFARRATSSSTATRLDQKCSPPGS